MPIIRGNRTGQCGGTDSGELSVQLGTTWAQNHALNELIIGSNQR
jgi:hypothetical protein